MTITLFISHAPEDAQCAAEIRQGLADKGYSMWRAPDYPTPTDASYSYVVENGIIASAVVLLLWSESAARFDWAKRHLAFAQRLAKPMLLVTLDNTPLPGTLLVEPLVADPAACGEVVAHVLPRLPAPDSADPFLAMCELAAHEYIRNRKQAIELAAGMVQRGEHTPQALAILEYLAHNDLMSGVRDNAQAVLNAQPGAANAATNTATPTPHAQAPTRSLHDEQRHKFRARCQERAYQCLR